MRRPLIDYHALVSGGRVHGSLYRDPQVFQRELEQIWHKVWVYLCHESELPQARRLPAPPDRHAAGARGARRRQRHPRVLQPLPAPRQPASATASTATRTRFRCPYHAWTYAKDGALLEPTFEEGYDNNLSRADFSLTPVPRQDAYRGLIFASVSPAGPSLREHLGQVTEFIDLFMDVSPTGEIDLNSGVQKLRYHGNWKLLPENSLEGDYHGPFIHRFAFEMHSRRTGLNMSSLYENQVPDVIRSLPGGPHGRGLPRRLDDAAAAGHRRPARQAYLAPLEERYGKEKARQLTSTTPPLVFVFPNLIYIMTHIRRFQPVSVNETYVYYQPMLLKGAPAEINEARLREHEFGFGPAGFISPDDIEIMERNQIGVQAHGNDWQYIARGLHRVRDDARWRHRRVHHGREPPARHVAALRAADERCRAMRDRPVTPRPGRNG